MSGKYLLDTNIIIALFNGNKTIADRLDMAEMIFVSMVVFGELLYGAKNSQRPDENVMKIEQFLTRCSLLDIDRRSAEAYSDIKLDLKKKGRPIPENDIWIAASAIQHGLILVTRDRDFDAITGLIVEKW